MSQVFPVGRLKKTIKNQIKPHEIIVIASYVDC